MSSVTQRRADITKIAALEHPLRRRLLEVLDVDGPATASRLAGRTDQLVGNVSHHLKMLAKAGLIEEAVDMARDRRERWWRRVPMAMSWSVADMAGGSSGELHAEAARQQEFARHVDKMHQWFETRSSFHPDWMQAADSTESWLLLTPEELVELTERLADMLADFRSTVDLADGQEREHVFLFAHAVPARP